MNIYIFQPLSHQLEFHPGMKVQDPAVK